MTSISQFAWLAPTEVDDFDADGNATSTTDALGNTVSTTYNPLGLPGKLPDPSNANIQIGATFDKDGYFASTTNLLTSATTSYARNMFGDVFEIDQPNPSTGSGGGPATKQAFDANGNLLRSTDPLGNITSFGYDELGDQVTASLPNASTGESGGATTTRRYDLDQQIVATIDPLGNTMTSTFDAYGNQIASSLPNVTTGAPGGPTTTYTFDANHNMLSLTDPDSNVTSWTVDNDQRTLSETTTVPTLSGGGSTTATEYYTRDLAGNLSELVDYDGRATTYAYNFAGQEGSENWYSTSDTGGTPLNTLAYAYSTRGEMLDGSDADTSVALAYNAVGNLTGDTQSLSDRADAALSATWNSDGTRSGISLSIGATADLQNSYTYDNLERMTGIAQTSQGEATNVTNKYVAIGYNLAGLMTSVDAYLASSADSSDHVYNLSIGYDDDSRPTSMAYTAGTSGNPTLAAYAYVYGTDGTVSNFWSYNDTADTTDRTSAYTTWAEASYGYDADQELAASFVSGGSGGSGGVASASYANWTSSPTTDAGLTYDANGNRTDSGHTAVAGNRIAFDGEYYYLYDTNGNRTAKFQSATGDIESATDITIYGWDNRNRMISLTHYADSTAMGDSSPDMDIRETYDAMDRLVEEKDVASGGTLDERYVWDGESLLAVLDSSDNVTERELNGPAVDQVFATEMVGGDDPGTNWLLADALHSTRDVLRATVSDGVVTAAAGVDHLIYNAFGALAIAQSGADAQVQTRVVFTGLLLDPASGMDRSITRIYDPLTTTWISQDPSGFWGGDTNLYRYCLNNPTTYIDPTGLYGEPNSIDRSTLQTIGSIGVTGSAPAPALTAPSVDPPGKLVISSNNTWTLPPAPPKPIPKITNLSPWMHSYNYFGAFWFEFSNGYSVWNRKITYDDGSTTYDTGTGFAFQNDDGEWAYGPGRDDYDVECEERTTNHPGEEAVPNEVPHPESTPLPQYGMQRNGTAGAPYVPNDPIYSTPIKPINPKPRR